MNSLSREELLILSAALGNHTTADLRVALREEGQPDIAERIHPIEMAMLSLKLDVMAGEVFE